MTLRRRRKSLFPRIEHLEPRLVLSDIGINLASNATDTNDPIWVDVHNTFVGWGAGVPVNSDNYPLENASTGTNLGGYPDGNYLLSYQGTGTVTFSGIGYLAGPLVTGSNGVTTGTVVINHQLGNGKFLFISVSGVSPSATISNLHLYVPGYGSNPTQMFTNTFLHQLQPFSTLRFMNWMQTNGSTVSTWQERTPPTSFLATGPAGVPYEDMIELANESQKDMWINIPALATSNYVQNLAELIDTELDPNLKVYLEYSNETWNNGDLANSQILQAAQSNPLVTATDPFSQVEQQSAFELYSSAQIFDQVFGTGSARIRPVLGGWAAIADAAQTQLQFIQTNYGAPSQYIWGVSIAPYLSLPGGDDVPGLTINQLFADLNQDLNTKYVSTITANQAVAQAYNIPLVAYEGGESMYAFNNLNYAVKEESMADPRMHELYDNMMTYWYKYAGPNNLFMPYELSGQDSQFGSWGLLQEVSDSGSQKFDALIAQLLPAGDANLDGTVDYADFQILAADYGMTNAWWEQGDFNDNGVVNWADLNILRTNLDPASVTLNQFAQMALFGQPSTISSGQVSEYDGYGAAFISNMPWVSSSNGQGPVQVDETSTGASMWLGGMNYSQGLGVNANSQVVVNLGGQYARFESEIGVDSPGGTSAVVFQVYGDGNLLYQSPTVTAASGGIPIDLNVAGVQQLSLVVNSATGSTVGDHAVWADARLISTANFNQFDVSPYTLTWQVSQNGSVLLDQTTDSFLFPYSQPGVYTITLTVSDGLGDLATSSTNVTVNPTASATLIGRDATTEGNWIGVYGDQGYSIVGGSTSLPAYATVTPTGQSTLTWFSPKPDPRALQNAGGTGRVAAAWDSSTRFTVAVNLADGQAHDLSLYAVDWDNAGRSEQIQITDAATGVVLDTETVSSFSGGVYLEWKVTGSVLIQVTNLAGPNAVLSGLFLDATASAVLVGQDSTTQGSWLGAYGAQGYNLAGVVANFPSYAAVSFTGQSTMTWADSPSQPQFLQVPGNTGGLAYAWYSPTSFSVNVKLIDGQAHDLSLYAVDLGNEGRSEQIQLTDAASGAVLDTETVSSFAGGVYLEWRVTGSVVIQVTNLAGSSAVISGLFFDPTYRPAAAASLAVLAPTTATAGSAFNITVTAKNVTDGTLVNYTGTVHFNSSDPLAVLPADYTFTLGDQGTHTFRVTLESAAISSITVTDTANPALSNSPPTIAVSPAAVSSLALTGYSRVTTPGAVQSFGVAAYDAYGNLASSYTGTVDFTSSDPAASLPASYTFTASDAGDHTFTFELNTSGTQTITVTDSAGQLSAMSSSILVLNTAPVTVATIWSSAATPANPSQNDSSAINVGVKFDSSVVGLITGIRFYKGSGNTGTHVGYLWTSTGTLLASATFSNETASGWQQVNFTTPVAIAAGTTYVASYFAPMGHYADDSQYFASSGVTSGPLTALSSSAAGGNGVYLDGASGGFPTISYESSNYWVDVVFSTASPTVIATSPAAGAAQVMITAPNITATFNEPVQSGTISFVLENSSDNTVPATLTYNASTGTATLTPNALLVPATTYTATVSGAEDSAGNTMASPFSWSFTTITSITNASIWSDSAVPVVASVADNNAVEVGVRFDSAVAGYITGIRFYKAISNTGTHVGHLWTSTGTLLASATFTGETADGWQQVNFSTPVAITAGTTYIGSYFAPAGYYAGDNNYFASSGVTDGVLTALASSAAAGNGVYLYSSTGGFPTKSYESSNYWVDVEFSSTLATPAVTSTTPTALATGVSNTAPNITATFNEAVESNTISFVLKDSSNNTVAATQSFSAATDTVTLTPDTALAASTTYTATVSGAQNVAGGAMPSPVSWSFTTATQPTVTSTTPASWAFGVSTAAPNITVAFNQPVQANTISFTLQDSSNNSVAATSSYNAATDTVTLTPGTALTASSTYTAIVSGAQSLAGNAMASPVSWSFTTAAAMTNATIWPATATPTDPASTDSRATELGVQFESSVSGFVTGIRFYKGSGNTGTHVGHLWTSTGTLLASATFTGETATGWQQVNFSKPVAIAAGTTYIGSYFAPVGHYADDAFYFASAGVANGVLTAPSGSVAGGNGVYVYGAGGGFPIDTYHSTNYWVDVVFSAQSSAPTVTGVTPAAGATGVLNTVPNITATFSEPVQIGTVSFVLEDSNHNTVAAAVTYNASTDTATLTPNSPLAASSTYTATVSGAVDLSGNMMTVPVSWSFTTAAAVITSTTTIWSSTATPAFPAVIDPRAVELGIKFSSSVAGAITGIRFYKGSGNTGTHVGHLWTSTGTLLASATFTNETATGWQQVNFTNPVAIAAGTTYIASYFAPVGDYADNRNYFASSGVTNGVLTAPSSSAAGGNGVYLYGAGGGFPIYTYESSNYWVDVVFGTSVSSTAVKSSSMVPLDAAQPLGAAGFATTLARRAAISPTPVVPATTTVLGSTDSFESDTTFAPAQKKSRPAEPGQ